MPGYCGPRPALVRLALAGCRSCRASGQNRWVLGIVDAWHRDGARLIAEGGLSAADIVAALDATEPAP